MTHNIIENIKNYFTSPFYIDISNNLDEPSGAIEKAISAIIPTSLAALVSHPEKNDKFYHLAKSASMYYSKVPDVALLVNEEQGSELHREVFGNSEKAVARHVAAYANVRPTTAESLIMLVLPVLMGKIGEQIVADGISEAGFNSVLSGISGEINSITPPGYTVPDLSHDITPSKEDSKIIHQEDIARSKSNFVYPKWLPVLIIAIVVLLLIYFSRM